MKAVHILVSGIVQGVGYRWWTARVAGPLGIAGWVRNLYDGRVEIWAEGADDALEQLEARCHDGPRSADVTSVIVEFCDAVGMRGFETRGDAATPD